MYKNQTIIIITNLLRRGVIVVWLLHDWCFNRPPPDAKLLFPTMLINCIQWICIVVALGLITRGSNAWCDSIYDAIEYVPCNTVHVYIALLRWHKFPAPLSCVFYLFHCHLCRHKNTMVEWVLFTLQSTLPFRFHRHVVKRPRWWRHVHVSENCTGK